MRVVAAIAIVLTANLSAADDVLSTIKVPPGFTVELVASAPLVERPMMACFDERGRLFVTDSSGVNLKIDELQKNPPHCIRMLEDTNGDRVFDKSTIFADKMTFPMGVLCLNGAVYSCSPPSLWKLEDTDGDGVCDKRTELVTKFGSTGNAADIHGPFLGPDGRLYFTDGRHGHEIALPDGKLMSGKAARIFRCKPDGSELEVVCGGGMDNPVEIAFTEEGEPLCTVALFQAQPARVDAIIHCIEGGTFPYHDVVKEFKRTGDLLPPVTPLGWVAPAGFMRYRDAVFGAEYENNFFSALFNVHKVQRHIVERSGASFTSKNEDFLVSSHTDFHPTDVLEDADGSLLVIDTGGWFRIGCPNSRIAKPDVKGGIYRVRKTEQPKAKLPYSSPTRAFWKSATPESARAALTEKNASIRIAAAHVIGLDRDKSAFSKLIDRLENDDIAAVRRESATALGRIKDPKAVPELLAAMNSSGGDRFLEHSIIYALIQIAAREPLLAALKDESPAIRRAALIALDQIDGDPLTADRVVPLLESPDAALQQTALDVALRHPEWAPDIAAYLKSWLTPHELSEAQQENLRNILLAFCRDAGTQTLIAQSLEDTQTPAATKAVLLESIARSPLDKLPVAWESPLTRSLENADERVTRQAIEAIRAKNLNTVDAMLLKLADAETRPAEMRVAALSAAIARLKEISAPLFTLLLSSIDKEKPPLLRLAAADTLGRAPLDDSQLATLAMSVPNFGAMELPKILSAFERSKSAEVGHKLLAGLNATKAVNSLTPDALRSALKNFPDEIRAEAAPLLKKIDLDGEEQKAKLAQLEPLLTGGDAKHGREVFFSKKAVCSTCHAIQNQGARVGPDLSKIGSIRASRDLLESIVFPSASFARGYEPWHIKTTEGKIVDGIIARESADALVLYGADRAEIRVPRASIRELKQSRVSIMPQGLDAALSKEELSDLIAYLLSLK
jgi:putative membrane-bound dehydrogenase-like protein